MPPLSPSQRRLRDAIKSQDYDGFMYVCKYIFKIKDKQNNLIPLNPNSEQKKIARTIFDQLASLKPVRVYILKGRKAGITTILIALMCYLAMSTEHTQGIILAHQQSASDEIAEIAVRFADHIPAFRDRLAPQVKHKHFRWKKNGSHIRVETQRAEDALRGATPRMILASELSSWDSHRANSTAEQTMTSLLGSMASLPGTIFIVESTAKGRDGNTFYERWTTAQAKPDGVWSCLFLSWAESDRGTETNPTLTPEEELLYGEFLDLISQGKPTAAEDLYFRRLNYPPEWCAKAVEHKLTPAQVRFALHKIEEFGGSGDMFAQEYPLTAEECFLGSGRPVIAHQYLPPPTQSAVVTSGDVELDAAGVLQTTVGDTWQIFTSPVQGWTNRYVCSADVSSGTGGDYACIQVVDRVTNTQAATYYSDCTAPDELAHQMMAIGHYFDDAWLVPETNNHGVLTMSTLRNAKYPRIWQTAVVPKSANSRNTVATAQHFGWLTTAANRTPIIDQMAGLIRTAKVTIVCTRTLKELRSLVWTKRGKAEAPPNSHDDAVMALAIALEVSKHLPAPQRIPSPTRTDTLWSTPPKKTKFNWG